MIRTQDLYFSYHPGTEDEIKVLKGINLEVKEGEFLAVIGRNGSGKSTFARHLNALLAPVRGDVFIDELNTKDEKTLWEIRSNVGMVFQNPDSQLISTVVEEDAAFGPENLGIPRQEIINRIDKSLKAVSMEDKRYSPPHLLSGGQKQRVAIAGVLAMNPKYLVMDEPTSMLDSKGRAEVREVMKRLNKDGMTVIYITHFMEEAVDASRIVVMEMGEIVMDGSPAEVFEERRKLEELNLGLPAAAELAGELRDAGLKLPEGILSMEELAEGVANIVQ